MNWALKHWWDILGFIVPTGLAIWALVLTYQQKKRQNRKDSPVLQASVTYEDGLINIIIENHGDGPAVDLEIRVSSYHEAIGETLSLSSYMQGLCDDESSKFDDYPPLGSYPKLQASSATSVFTIKHSMSIDEAKAFVQGKIESFVVDIDFKDLDNRSKNIELPIVDAALQKRIT